MLKPEEWGESNTITDQPPSGGCVLKLNIGLDVSKRFDQPPSGGCVLKHILADWLAQDCISRLQAAVC